MRNQWEVNMSLAIAISITGKELYLLADTLVTNKIMLEDTQYIKNAEDRLSKTSLNQRIIQFPHETFYLDFEERYCKIGEITSNIIFSAVGDTHLIESIVDSLIFSNTVLNEGSNINKQICTPNISLEF